MALTRSGAFVRNYSQCCRLGCIPSNIRLLAPFLVASGTAQRLESKRSYHASSQWSLQSKEDQGMVLFDSLSDSFKSIAPPDDKGLAWYTCGPTTYAPAHLGHARTYVSLDIIRRVLEHSMGQSEKPAPLFVMNITDVDDKILAAAKETGEAPITLARRYEKEFWSDLDALGCLRPHVVTRVTEHVTSDLIPFIQKLVDTEMAYVSDDGVYFDVCAYEAKLGNFTKYGKLAPPSAASDSFILHEFTPILSQKKDQRDFVLWKNKKEEEDLFWSSPWGEGRPGWHIECSAMIHSVQEQFQATHKFHVHAGGVDLKFPHHTNEIAQSEAYLSTEQSSEWIPHWVHTGHLNIQGLKMSKSLKNFVTIRELLEVDSTAKSALTSPPDDFRLWCLGLSGSYRGPASYSKERLIEARKIREKLVKFLTNGETWILGATGQTLKKWTAADHELFTIAQTANATAYQALIGNLPGSQKSFDLDGSSFIDAMLKIAEAGNAHMIKVKPSVGATEPVRFIIDLMRTRLRLVGFSTKTTSAGLDIVNASATQSKIVGGERALAEVLIQFRTQVRRVALFDATHGNATENTTSILSLCDDLRDVSLPSLGLELVDQKPGDYESPSWRFCLPKDEDGVEMEEEEDPEEVVPTDYFQIGKHAGAFTSFDPTGLPVTNADGTLLSNSLRKKLGKEFKKDKKMERKMEIKKIVKLRRKNRKNK